MDPATLSSRNLPEFPATSFRLLCLSICLLFRPFLLLGGCFQLCLLLSLLKVNNFNSSSHVGLLDIPFQVTVLITRDARKTECPNRPATGCEYRRCNIC
jgi:hypothetical protein